MNQVIRDLRRTATEDWPILAGACGVWAVLVLLLAVKGVNGLQAVSYRNNLLLYLVMLVVFTLLTAGWRLYCARPKSPIGFLVRLAGEGEVAGRFIRGVPMLTALVIFMPVFSAMKSAIPLFNSRNWDAAFIAADQVIHGGDAWLILQPVLGFPIVTSALSIVYFLWFFVIYAASIYFCFLSRDRELRAQYFITYFASWTICGVFLATLFASVGPCFVGPLLGDHRFDDQMAYLRAANEHYPVLILHAQEFLLAARIEASGELGGGISAMPSMHVAMATLVALSAARISRAAAVVGFGFLVLTLLGSVHLAPHYAVDGYVSIAVTLALWPLAARLARQIAGSAPRMPQPGRQPEIAPA